MSTADLVAKMRARACAVYLATDESVADDIAAILRAAADEITEQAECMRQMQEAIDLLHEEVSLLKGEIARVMGKG